jgi:hypothetical protein
MREFEVILKSNASNSRSATLMCAIDALIQSHAKRRTESKALQFERLSTRPI